jgi:hypothetical protein
MKRHRLAVRRATTVAQKPPEDYKDVIINFILYVQRLWQEKKWIKNMLIK